jgi:ABC-type lipoprotein export system ATPase subunit
VTAAVCASDLFAIHRAAYGEVAALRGLTVEVAAGEVVAVLGPSGAGKTTFLNLCAGFNRPTSGELLVLGQPIDRAGERQIANLRRESIGIVRQHYHRVLPRGLVSSQIVEFPLRLAGFSGADARRRAAGFLRAAGLERRALARPSELSGGEQQRLAVCAALAKEPRLVLADEPTGELDPVNSMVVVELLLGLAARAGSAALIVTHDPAVAERTDRTIHIHDGRLAAEGTADPTLVIDDRGWVRLPASLREISNLGRLARAKAEPGRIELIADATAEPTPAIAPGVELRRGDAHVAVELVAVCRSHSAQDRPTLEAVSEWFAPARLHVVAGPSGSGKTTLLNLIAGLDEPDRGEIRVDGTRVDQLTPDDAAHWRQRVLGHVSQHSTLVDFLSARENVELALAVRGVGRQEASAAAERWLRFVGLGSLAGRRGDRLSGGEQRRVALARALAPEPSLLVADEPTAHLDRASARLVIALLADAAHECGMTVITATHDADLIAAADNTVDLGHGRDTAAP